MQASPQLTIITAATQVKGRPAAKAVIAALLAAEKAAKQQRLAYSIEELQGEWRLCFATGTRKQRQGGIALGRGFYLPGFLQAQIGFEQLEPERLGIHNQIQVGALCLRLTGPARYHSKNLLAFDFTQLELRLLGRQLYSGQFGSAQTGSPAFEQKPIAKLPFFSFFLVTASLIAARGRGGGLAIWTRVPDKLTR